MPSRALRRAPTNRAVWVDIVKGIAIVLVVVHHAAALAVQNGLADPVWQYWSESVRAFRMPLFFFASGLFAGSVVRRSWGRLWNTRLAQVLWMAVLWAALRFAYFSLVPMPGQSDESSLVNLLLSPVRPFSALWFLQALAVFLVVAKLTSRMPAWLPIAASALLSCLVFAGVSFGNIGYNGMGRYAVYFFLALHLKTLVLKRMSKARPIPAVALSVAVVLAAVVVSELGLARVPGVRTALGVVAVAAGILVARLIAATVVARPLAYIGRNTLPVYVTHVMLVAAAIEALHAAGFEGTDASRLVLPVVLAVTATAMSLLIARGVRGTGLRFLYEVPGLSRGSSAPMLETVGAR